MKRIMLTLAVVCAIAIGVYLIAADHLDAPAVGSLAEGSSLADITDYYAFESPDNADNYVFVCNVSGLTAPSATAAASFDEEVMYEFNIDTDADNVEDLVIQALFRDGKVIAFGPIAPSETGRTSRIENEANRVESEISTYNEEIQIGEANGMKVFAGPRDDPFFMDFFRFVAIVNGVAKGTPDGEDPTAFNNPGQDTFAGTNVLSVVVEVPKDMLGDTNTFTSWVESKRKM
ncbi:DUF4331 family protein [Rapidithrix thailandica]|uniref:DUF4331 family protein n=1 Tax=Rapidithrix thailandica TaxID=413964 RepID=A0AAW9S0F9_9BACT